VRVRFGNVELAGDHRESVSGLGYTHTRQVQVAQFLRADYVKPIGRGNRQNRYNFSVTRKHDSNHAAQNFLFEHPLALPDEGTLQIVALNAGGAETVWRGTNGQLLSVSPRLIGLTTIFAYSLIAGIMSKST